jgi:hypothetical protein
MLRAQHLFKVRSGVAVPCSVSQQDDAPRRRERGGNARQ